MTLIELLTTLTVLGILVNVSVPAINTMRRKADAARIIGDINVIRVAAYDHYAGLNFFPPTQPWAVPPATMIQSLPQGFVWTYKDAQYRWVHFVVPGGVPGNPSQTSIICVEVQTPDTRLMAAITGLYKGQLTFGSPTDVYFVLN